MMELLKLRTVSKKAAEVYHFQFEPHGWAIVLLDESTGTICIHSDYGDWNYSWSAAGRGEGKSLKEFLLEGDKSKYAYLTDKFMMGVQDKFDLEGSRRAMHEKLDSRLEVGLLTKEKHTELRHELNELEELSGEIWVERWSQELSEELGECPWEEFEYEEPHIKKVLREQLLPAIIPRLAIPTGVTICGEPLCSECHKEIEPGHNLTKDKCPHCGFLFVAPPPPEPSTAMIEPLRQGG